MKRILIIEDDKALARGLCHELALSGYELKVAHNATKGYICLTESHFNLVILDVNLPDEDGFSLCRRIKAVWDVPVVFLTARDLDADQLQGFELGADDYVTKPFKASLLIKRVAAILRRTTGNETGNTFYDGYLEVDFDTCIAKCNHIEVTLTPTEYKLLGLFVSHSGKVLSRNSLLSNVWDIDENFVDEHALTVNINRLRKKLEDDAHKYIKTVYGMGYMWMGDVK